MAADPSPQRLPISEVTASSNDGNLPANTIDDDLATRWSAKGDGEWIRFDLGSVQTLGYAGIAFHSGSQRFTKFEIEVSADGVAWTKVFSGRSSGKTEAIEVFDFPDQTARYLRIIGRGNSKNDWNSLTEVHLYSPNPAGLVLTKLEPKPKEAPVPVAYIEPGLINPDGSEHVLPRPNPVTGKTLNVLDFGADPTANAADDRPAIQKAIDSANPGDEVYLPNGVYNLHSGSETDRVSHLTLKSGVNLRGQSQAGAILVSNFNPEDNQKYNTRVLKAFGLRDILISNLTVTSTFNGKYSTDHRINNPHSGGPVYGIHLEDYAGEPCRNITINGITVEKFQRTGIRVSKSHDVAVRNCVFQNATDVGGGGAGYGITLQGEGHDKNRIGHANDSRYNLVENCRFLGPYLRHGIIIQYFTHNNAVRNNVFEKTILDAIDLHGEDEYFNEVYGNQVRDVLTGAGIALGNTGATHDASGPYNHIHGNTITNCREGIKVSLGSPDTLIENNMITGCSVPAGRGIYVLNAPRTMIRGNKISGNNSDGFWGILLAHDAGDPKNGGAGDPQDIQIIGNQIHNNRNGLKIETGTGIVVKGNRIANNQDQDFVSAVKVSDQEIPLLKK